MTRFTDRVTRDLHQIADRATPSSTAWDSIRTRIESQTDQPTVEVIMLSPDRNNSPKRGWMLAAAAGTVILIGGLVFATTRSDDDTVPADAPQATAPVDAPEATSPAEPAPDAEVDPAPAPDAGVEQAPDATPAVEDAPPAAVPGTVTGTYSFEDVGPSTAPSSSGVVGKESWQGTAVFEGQMAGTAPGTWQTFGLPDFRLDVGEFVFDGTIEGLGTGTLSFIEQRRLIEGTWVKSVAVITGGTGDFEGAYGSGEFESDPVVLATGTAGTYSWVITVPPAGSSVTVTATGTQTSIALNGQPGFPGFSQTLDMTGSLVGTAKGSGQSTVPVGNGTSYSTWEFTGTIDGLGTGTMTYDRVGVGLEDGRMTWMDIVTGGTGDFEGIAGTGQHDPDDAEGAYLFVLTAPVNQ